MNRRKALGALIGGVAAGPQAAKAEWTQLPSQSPSYPMPGNQGTQIPLDNTAERLAQAKRILSGDFSDFNSPAPEVSPYRYLRSISESGRQVMQQQHYERRWKARMLENAQGALAEYDKTGILRHLF